MFFKCKPNAFIMQVPASSGQLGIDLSDSLAASGKSIFGWDQEWNADWGSVRKRYGGSAMYGKLNARHTKSPQKIVLLMHDAAFRPAKLPSDLDYRELDTFVELAAASGYTFSTMDSYVIDDPFRSKK